MLLKLGETKEQLECCRSQVFLLSSALACAKQRANSLKIKLRNFPGEVTSVQLVITSPKAYKEGKLKEKAGLVNILDTISQKLCKKKKGKRYRATSKDFYEVLLTMGGHRLCDFVSQNLDGPHVHSAMVWRNDNAMTYVLGGHTENIETIATLYKNAKERMSLSNIPVPYIKAEDETAIIPRPEYKSDTDEVWGFCGRKGPDYICEESFIVSVGDDDGTYQQLLNAFQNCQVATHARVIMINPLLRKLPKVLLLQANCNRLHTMKFSTSGLYLTHSVRAF